MLLLASIVGILKGLMLFFFLLAALLLIIVVLLQEPKGGGLSGAFGGAGAETFGVQAGGVNKFTAYVAGAFLGLAILYAAIRPPEAAAPSDVAPPSMQQGGGAAGGAPSDDEEPAPSGDEPAGEQPKGD